MAVLAGCTVVGPRAVLSGRTAYNEAINETNNQQMLKVFVNNRYEETNSMLAVASVTANVSVSSSARIEAGFGDSDNYDGNLVPFSGGFVYEENPTISYTPVTGERYMRQLMSPLPISVVAQITQSIPHPETAYTMLISSVNGIRNPAFLYGSQQVDADFERFVTSMTALAREHCVHWIDDPQSPEAAELVIETGARCEQSAGEMLRLLGIGEPAVQTSSIALPVVAAHSGGEVQGIALTTRTLWNLVEILSAAVEVPAADLDSGRASSFPRLGKVGDGLQIHYSPVRPDSAYVAVEHREGWFYIDDGDFVTKRYFKLLSSLWSAAMANTLGPGQSAPVLTVPVSR